MGDRQSNPEPGLEDDAMFELDTAIHNWRLSFGESMRKQDLNELEEHLRCDVAALVERELNEEEALLVARHRVGGNGELMNEFAKVHRGALWIGRAQWMIVGILGLNIMGSVTSIADLLAGWGALALELGSTSTMFTHALVQIAAFALVAVGLLYVARARLDDSRRLVRLCLALAIAAPICMLGKFAATAYIARMLSVHDLGYTVMLGRYVSLAAAALLPLALFFAVYLLERKRRLA